MVRSQLGECFKSIIYVDYPQQWPDLLQTFMHNMNTQVEIYNPHPPPMMISSWDPHSYLTAVSASLLKNLFAERYKKPPYKAGLMLIGSKLWSVQQEQSKILWQPSYILDSSNLCRIYNSSPSGTMYVLSAGAEQDIWLFAWPQAVVQEI